MSDPERDESATAWLEKDTIEASLAIHRKTGSKCPMCATSDWWTLDGYSTVDVQENPANVVIGGRYVPVATIVCKNCGFVSQHSLFVLGLRPPEPPK